MSAVVRQLVTEPMRHAAERKVMALEAEVEVLRQAEAASIANVKVSGTWVPDGYWRKRYVTELKLEAARGALEAIAAEAALPEAGADG